MIWALLVRNPLASALGALFVALGIYTTVLKVDNVRLASRNGTLEQAEERRVELAASALRENQAKIETDKQRTKKIEVDDARLQKTINSLYADNKRLAADIKRMRDTCPGSNPMPPDAPNTAQRIAGDTPLVSGEGTDLLVELAREADKVRASLISCQSFVKGL